MYSRFHLLFTYKTQASRLLNLRLIQLCLLAGGGGALGVDDGPFKEMGVRVGGEALLADCDAPCTASEP